MIVLNLGWPITWKSGNSGKCSGKHFDEKVRETAGKFMKNCHSQGKVRKNKILLQIYYKMFIFHILSKDKSYQCHF